MGSRKSSKMRSFLVICAVIAVAVAKKGNGGKRDSGVCMEDDEVVAMCTFGTSIGSKLEAAATACENADQAAGRKRRPGKGNGKKCPTVEEIWNMIEGKMGDEFCVFQQIGWLDENYEFDNATAMADIASLPEAVSMAIDENEIDPIHVTSTFSQNWETIRHKLQL